MRSLRALMPVAIVAATLAVVLGGKRLLFEHPGGFVLRAELADAAGLRKNSAVKIGGVPGGRVTAIELTRRDTALVTMRLDDTATPVGAGAQARARPVNLLGEKYVDLDVGDRRRPLAEGARIPLARTASPVELDDVLNVLDPDVRARLRILINEAGVALAGRGADFNGLLAGLPPALDQLERTIADLGTDTRQMERLLDRGGRVFAAVAGRGDQLGRLVDRTAGALTAAAERRGDLRRTVGRAPATVRQLRTTIAALGDAATRLAPAARQLRRSAPALATTLARLPRFAADADPTLRTAERVAPTLARLGRRGADPVARLRPMSDRLARFSREIDPLLGTFDRGGARELLGFVHGYARAQQQRDGAGHVLRLRGVLGREAVLPLLDRYAGADRQPAAPAQGARSEPRAPVGGLLDLLLKP